MCCAAVASVISHCQAASSWPPHSASFWLPRGRGGGGAPNFIEESGLGCYAAPASMASRLCGKAGVYPHRAHAVGVIIVLG